MEPEHYQNKRKKTSSLKLGLIVSAIWAVAQFGISEISYRIGLSYGSLTDTCLFTEFSEVVAWPAVEFYHGAKIKVFQEALNGIEVEASERKKWDVLLARAEDSNDTEAEAALWIIFKEHSLDPSVDTVTEYTIYIGTCIAWGFAISLAVTTLHFLRSGI